MLNQKFWENKHVFITGHTGFKGSWLCIWLSILGAKVTGFALNPPTSPSLYNLAGINKLVTTIRGDVRDKEKLYQALVSTNPDVMIHMAAQPLVRESYLQPVDTYEVNVLGTVNFFEAIRRLLSTNNKRSNRAVINVTTDKCYENQEWYWGYREGDALGGFDPYSNSKACSELVTSAYRNSYFNDADYRKHGVAIASARAGNVIGGGDWAKDRLIPDCIRSLLDNKSITIRNPHSIRPWQHVLEPLGGYLLLAQKLYENGPEYATAWNFGPKDSDVATVEMIVKELCKLWGRDANYSVDHSSQPYEANYLKLDCSKAKVELNWEPRWNINKTIEKIIEWNTSYQKHESILETCISQIKEYQNTNGEKE
jgi:CDP-glucose 4,6-dehydratase